jgi:hypothetical protein
MIKVPKGNLQVAWIIDNSFTIREVIVPMMIEFPPLTTRMTLQLAFVIKAIKGMTIDEYFYTRGDKYVSRLSLGKLVDPLALPSYFTYWLGGFIEAEGCFSMRKVGNYSFSIAQLHDYYLMEAIRFYFNVDHLTISVKQRKGVTLYELSIGSLSGVESVISICQPILQGYKYVQLAEFTLKVKTQMRYLFWKKPQAVTTN